MKYSEVQSHLEKNKALSRSSWPDGDFICKLNPTTTRVLGNQTLEVISVRGRVGVLQPFIVKKDENGWIPWAPQLEDFQAEDWEITED